MLRRLAAVVAVVVVVLLALLPDGAFSGGGCWRRCGGATWPYPLGFSAGCPVVLACEAGTSTALLPSGGAAAAPYRVMSFNTTTSTMVVSVQALCSGRSVEDTKGALYGVNYGVSSRTGMLLRGVGCRNTTAAGAADGICKVPEKLMSALLRTDKCNGASQSLTCVASTPPPPDAAAAAAAGPVQFLQWKWVAESGCHDAVTSAVLVDTAEGAPSVQFSVAELGWWANGTCAAAASVERCAANASCSDVQTPGGGPGHRCTCVSGMSGDGFVAGDGCYRSSAKKSVPFIVGGVLAGAAAAVAAAGVLLLRRSKRRRSGCARGGSGTSRRRAAMRLLSEAASSSGVPVYSYHEVARATGSFSHEHRLGTGAYGTVYVGRLPASSPTPVAIKRLRCRHHDGDEEAAVALLINEIKLISSLSHPNLVRLLGCCLDRGEQILVYEFMPNGTLSHHLLGNGGSGGGGALPWRARLGIAAETAAAIAYLHAMRPPIFHRDVKSSNILLGADLRAKLADFGLSRAARGLGGDDASRSHVSTAPQGTPGYVDPEYHQNFHLSDKSDVYSLGVVLLELITAMKVVDFDRPASEVNLASLALDRIANGRVGEIVDPALITAAAGDGEDWVMNSVQHVSELAFRCLAFHKDVRPCMNEVAAELRRIRDAAPDPTPETTTTTKSVPPDDDDGSSTTAAAARSPVSVQEAWVSDHSSPSTNGSMPRLM